MRWLDFLGGAAWAFVIDRESPLQPLHTVECQCKCACEPSPCPVNSWWWEILKVVICLIVGGLVQGLRLIQTLGHWAVAERKEKPIASTAVIEPILESYPSDSVQVLAQQQLEALRKRRENKQ